MNKTSILECLRTDHGSTVMSVTVTPPVSVIIITDKDLEELGCGNRVVWIL
jgi:hypothetical protein